MMETLKKFLASISGGNTEVVAVFSIVLVTAIVAFVVRLALQRLQGKLTITRNVYDDALVASARQPASLAVWIIGLTLAAQTLADESDAAIWEYIDAARYLGIIACLTLFGVRFVRYAEQAIIEDSDSEQSGNLDATTASAIAKILRLTIIITAVLTSLQTLGVSISGILAFGGVGGIAVGFAARDLLANFFGALMIFLDRPFSKGDWVRSPDRNIEGTVEDIGWRLTRIRTFDQRPLYVPNSVFTSLAVENPSRMLNRRIYETIGLRYDDVNKVQPVLETIRIYLKNHPAIDTKRTLMVNFNEFGSSSLDFFIYAFTKTTVWTEFHGIKGRDPVGDRRHH